MAKRKQFPRKPWTPEEVKHLIELRDKYTKSDIARLLKRSPSSISNKVRELELGGLMDNTDRWNFTQISEAVGVSKGVVNKTWVKHGLKFIKRGYFCLVEESELLRFMKTHPDLWNAAKCDYYLFYQYPWFLEKLEQDKKVPVEHRGYYWTDYQKQQFDFLVRKGCTHQQIADVIGKTKRAVDHYSAKMARKVIA
ncbi:MAG: helix-turn-helix domain-containing protein [Bacteroidales bacterium]|nr:helix-turn-helix domain-containing protein [Bacteroidales bacterium]